MKATKPTPRTPDWTLWKDARRLKLWEAIALSLNIDPRKIRISRHSWMAGAGSGPIFEEDSQFEDRLTIALSNLRPGGPFAPLALYVGVLTDRAAPIDLLAFGTWTRSIGWTVPEDLPQLPTPKELPEARRARLREAHEALKKSGNRAPTKTLAEREGISESRLKQLMGDSGKSDHSTPHKPFGDTRRRR